MIRLFGYYMVILSAHNTNMRPWCCNKPSPPEFELFVSLRIKNEQEAE
jgi:hypothetical protein